MRHLIILVFSLLSLSGFSQTGGVKPPPPPRQDMKVEVEPPPPMAVKEEEAQDEALNVASVQQLPVFPGGDAALFKYIAENIKYPAIAKENGTQGKVVLSFLISKTGQISNVQVLRGVGGGCDQEAIRVVNNMPDWSPGKHNGVPVNVRYTLPVSFKL